MPRRDELTVLLRSARQLAKLCEQGVSLLAEARDHHAPPAVMAAARQMASDLQRTKHEAEDVLVAFVLDCNRCGRRVHWVPGEGCKLGHWAHAEPARQRIIDPSSGDMTLAWIGVSSPDARERLSMW